MLSCKNTEYVLPPYTKGTERGNLKFIIKNISWTGRNFNNIELKVFWWGDDIKSNATVRLVNQHQPFTIKYKINTTIELFESYLSNAKSIELQLYSLHTKSIIGTVDIPVVDFMVSIRNQGDINKIIKRNIRSPRNNNIGEINIELKLKLRSIEKQNMLAVESTIVKQIEPKMVTKNSLSIDNFQIFEQRSDSKKPFKTNRGFYDLNKTDQRILMNYLTGEKMSQKDKKYAISELLSVSLNESFVESLTSCEDVSYNFKRNRSTKMTRNDKKENDERGGDNNQGDKTNIQTGIVLVNKGCTIVNKKEFKDTNTGNEEEKIVKVDKADHCDAFLNYLEGLFYIGNIDLISKPPVDHSDFIVIHSFWGGRLCAEQTTNSNFNYLDLFSIICDPEFLERIQNNFLVLELRERNSSGHEKILGNVTLPLHKFYIALHDRKIFEHLKNSKLPIISNDGWVSIKSTSHEILGKVEILLAIGTKEQIHFLKNSKEFSANSIRNQPQLNTIETQTCNTSMKNNTECSGNHVVTVEKLNKFINNLPNRPDVIKIPQQIPPIVVKEDKNVNVRKTSDLLDMLNIALTKNNPSISNTYTQTSCSSESSSSSYTNGNFDFFKANIEIEHAFHLPKTVSRHITKLKNSNKRDKSKFQNKTNRNLTEMEPNSYVVFPAFVENNSNTNVLLKSHEGPVYSTNIIEKNCSPIWNKKFHNIQIPIEYVIEPEKKFEFKVMAKPLNDLPQCRMQLNPKDDIIIGISKVDLNVLLSGLPVITGYFNIVDFLNHINGQIKITIEPQENLMKFAERNNFKNTLSNEVDLLMNLNENSFGGGNGGLCLSRALKRKFTELEEITQRLKTRLNDVTNDQCIDENFEIIDDEFENDLNTEVDEDDDENWPGQDNDEIFLNKTFPTNTYTNPNIDNLESPPSTSISTISSDRVKIISDALKNTILTDDDDE